MAKIQEEFQQLDKIDAFKYDLVCSVTFKAQDYFYDICKSLQSK